MVEDPSANDEIANSFMIVLFTLNAHIYPCKLVKFVRDSFDCAWITTPTEKAFTNPKGKEELFTNSFYVEDDLLMLMTWYNIIFVDRDLGLVKSIGIHTVDRCIRNVDCCN